MRVFDFSNQTEEKVNPECTYTTFRSNEEVSTPEHPIFVLDNKEKVKILKFILKENQLRF